MTPLERLERAWVALEQRGAVVHRVRLEGLTAAELGVLAYEAERRLRVLDEGREAGWVWLEAS